MARSIHRTFIAGVAAAAVLITALGAGQAQAQSRDTERALAALLGLAVVGAIIADRRSDRKDDRQSHTATRNQPHQWSGRDAGRDHRYRGQHKWSGRDAGRDHRYHGVDPRPLPQRAQRQLLPRECLRAVRTTRGGTAQVYQGQCLHQNYAFTRSLPRHCAQEIRGGRGAGWSTVWSAHCLERNGYRVSRR